MTTKNTRDKIILVGEDDVINATATKLGYQVLVVDRLENVEPNTLIIQAGVRFNWEFVANGFKFVERWSLAVPMQSYGSLAYDYGTPEDRSKTLEITGDLRILPYFTGLIFVGAGGVKTIQDWITEDGNRTLALIRSVFVNKPTLCVLPVSWVRSLAYSSGQFISRKFEQVKKTSQLVTVEIGRGQFVKAYPEDIGKVLEQYKSKEKKMPIVNSSKNWPLVTGHSHRDKGPLVRVELAPGQYVKMYKKDAIEAGHLKGEVQEPATEKVTANPPANDNKPDDLTLIPGVGPATAKQLNARGINTFVGLKNADLSFLSDGIQVTLKKWIEENGTDNTD